MYSDAVATTSETPVATLDDGTDLILRLRELRGERSYAELARCTGIRADELSKIENGKTTSISWTTLARIMRALHARPDQLFEIREPPTADSVTAGMIAAVKAGVVSPEVSDVWVRGEGRTYTDEADVWTGTEEDPSVELRYRRQGVRK